MSWARLRVVTLWGLSGLFLVLLLGAGCERRPPLTPDVGLYGPLTNTIAAKPPEPALPPREPLPPGDALLSAIQSEFSPATLWHATSRSVTLFAGLPRFGLGAPTFLAYSSPTGITLVGQGKAIDGTQLTENWILAGFAQAAGWTEWDSPWAVFFQQRPIRIRVEPEGVQATFPSSAGYFSLMPLYGYYKPPQKGREFLSRHELPEKDLSTWEWPAGLPRDPLTRLRYWAGVTRCFPINCVENVRVNRSRDVVRITTRFTWLEIPDAWGTRSIKLAPVSPALGLALTEDQSFPVRFSRKPMDFEYPTSCGPYFAIPNADEYDLTLPVLKYVNEAESPVMPVPSSAPPVVHAALERLRDIMRSQFTPPGADLTRPTIADIVAMELYARALPYCDADTQGNASVILARQLDELLVRERFIERPVPPDSSRSFLILKDFTADSRDNLSDAVVFNGHLLQATWAVAHHSGNRELVRRHWPVIRRLFTTGARVRWAGFGAADDTALCDEAATAIAFARLAYLAGDADTYQYACGIVARQLLLEYVRLRGAPWFRKEQPWHSLEPIPASAWLARLEDDLGWRIEPPDPDPARWFRLHSPDIARFYREHLRAEVTRRLSPIPSSSGHVSDPDPGTLRTSLVRLHSLLLHTGPTNLTSLTDAPFSGPAPDVIADCMALLRSTAPPRFQRLIPGAPPEEPVPGVGRDASGPGINLVQDVAFGTDENSAWPRILWPAWRAPSGDPWTFGEVRAGTSLPLHQIVTRPLNRTATQYLLIEAQ